MKKTIIPIVTLLFVLVLAACAPAGKDVMMEKTSDPILETEMSKPAETIMVEKTEVVMMEKTEDPLMTEAAEQAGSGMVDTPAWFGVNLTDVRTGSTFTINDFKGKVVLVENIATWCSTCKKQQQNVVELHQMVGAGSDFITVVLDVDPNENAESLKAYSEQNGFEFLYAIAPVEVVNEISSLYGTNFLNPPSAPMLIIDKVGTVSPLPFGLKSVEDLKSLVQPLLAQ